MKVNFILSDTTKHATTMALRRVTELSESDRLKDIIVLVPETKSIIIEEELLSLSKNKALINVFVYSFVRLLTRLAGAKPEGVLSKQAAVILLKKIILDNFDSLVCYKKTAKTRGFAEKIYETISQFKSSGIELEDLKRAGISVSKSLQMKLADIYTIYQKYEQYLSQGLMDECDRLILLKSFIKNSDLVKNSQVFVVGFDNITEEMERVLTELAANAQSTTFSCCYFAENRANGYIQKNELYRKFTHIAEHLKQPYNPQFFKTFESGDFYEISTQLFAPKTKEVKSKGNVEIFEAKNRGEELNFVASEIKRYVEGGGRYRQLGIFACDLEQNYRQIERVMEMYDIPIFINRSHDISSHFLIKFIQGAFVCVKNNFARQDVLKFVSNPLFAEDSCPEFINAVREYGIDHEEFLRMAEILPNEHPALQTGERLRVFFTELKKEILSAKTSQEYSAIVRSICRQFCVEERLGQIAKQLSDYGLETDSKITLVIFEKLNLVLDMLNTFLKDLCLDPVEFVQILESALGSVKIRLAPLSIDCVIISDSTDGFFDISQMFVIDALDGKFPAQLEDKGIILDSELTETNQASGKCLEPSVKQINMRENFRAFEALLEPKHKLILSYSCAAEGSKPSQIISGLVKIFGKGIVRSGLSEPPLMPIRAAENSLCNMVSMFLSADPLAPSAKDISQKFYSIRGGLSARLLWSIEHINAEPDGVSEELAKRVFDLNNSTSASRLEQYFKCPYMYFATYCLGLRENRDAKMNSMDIGTIVHRAIEIFSKNLKSIDEQNLEGKVVDFVNMALNENHIKVEKNKSLVKFVSSECIRVCRNILSEQRQSRFKNAYNEYKFGDGGELCLNLNGKKIVVNGKIDRIDLFKDKIRIIDYKTGEVSGTLKSIYYGEKIQLAMYLLAVEGLNKQVSALCYYPIHSDFSETDDGNASKYRMRGFLIDELPVLLNMDTGLGETKTDSDYVALRLSLGQKYKKTGEMGINHKVGNFLTAEEFEWLKNYTKKLCEKAIAEIESGYFAPSPLAMSKSNMDARCSYCNFRSVCGIERAATYRLCTKNVKEQSFKVKEAEDGD